MTRDSHDARHEAPIRRPGGSALRAFFSTKNPSQLKDSINDIRFFAKFCGRETEEHAEEILLGSMTSREHVQDLVTRYRDHMRSKSMAYGTINRRLAVIRTLLRMAKLIGAISWEIDVPTGEKSSRRDTRGVSKRAFKAAKRMDANTFQSRRDKAIVSLSHHAKLTRAEVVSLSLEHYDPNPISMAITVGARRIRLVDGVKADLDAWIEMRGFAGERLFTHSDDKRSPMSQDEIIALVRPGSFLS